MKRVLSIVFLVFIFSCKTEKKAKPDDITVDDLKNIMSFLTSDELEGRDTGSVGIENAAVYLETKLNQYGIEPYYNSYRDNFKVDSLDAFNIIGYLEGDDSKLKNEFVILSAHYDHIGIVKPINGDSIANGANDNATGVAAVLAMAKYFASKKDNKRSIMFVLFSAEEKGLLGSSHLSKRLKNDNLNLYTMVNFEMIGVPFKDRDYEAFVTGYDMSNMAKKINEYTNSKLTGFSEISKQHNLFKLSDNYPFYKVFNLPCQTIASCDLSNFDYYHHVDDEVDKLDFNFMQSLVNKIIPAIERMTNTPNKEIKMNHD